MKQFLRDKVLGPLIAAVLTSVVLGFLSEKHNGDWLNWLNFIPRPILWALWALGTIVILWSGTTLIYRLSSYLKTANTDSGPYCGFAPANGWVNLDYESYADVLWRVRAVAPSPYTAYGGTRNRPDRVYVQTPPRCPNCKTELEEYQRFWGGYTWTCAGCGFKHRNRHSYYRVARSAEKVANRHWEEELEQH